MLPPDRGVAHYPQVQTILVQTQLPEQQSVGTVQVAPLSPASPVQLPQLQLAEHVEVPQLPQGIVAGGAQTPPPEQADQVVGQVQLLWQVSLCVPVPQLPQAWVRTAPLAQAPAPEQADQVVGQVQLLWQVSLCVPVPQLPQA